MAQSWMRLIVGLLTLTATSLAFADPRPFTFVYDTYPEGKGNAEYEQWVTWRHGTETDNGNNRFDFRHEFEFGLADNFDLAVYVPTWYWEDGADGSRTRFNSIDVEAIVYLSNPVTDAVGSGLYFEINVGEDALTFEQKLLLHKDIGPWTVAYNLILETELEGVFKDDKASDVEVEGVLGHAFGISYGLDGGHVRLGAEAVIESVYENWNHYEETTVYAGPVINYVGGPHWWVTLTPVVQLSSSGEESDFAMRMIAGWEF